ncbi:MAG: TetR/AcrR family transcriptional regulator [Bacillota bacterium]
MKKTRKSSLERREEVLNIAQKIIYEKGFYNLTVRNIAERIGISEAAIYRHFKNKKEIIDKLTDTVFSNECEFELNSKKDSLEIFESFIDQQIERFEKNPYLAIISFQEDIFREYEDIKEKFIKHQKQREREIKKLIIKGQKENNIKKEINPEVFASVFMGSIRITISKWKNSNFSYSLKEKLNEIKLEIFKYVKEVK